MTETVERTSFFEELRAQRWDDHRFYHQSRVNQSLHLFSACCFLLTYALLPFRPVEAILFGWVVAMWSRQIGHFFFEPTGYDQVNDVSFEHKETIKVGYNKKRKIMMLLAWLSVPTALAVVPGVLSALEAITGMEGYVNNLAMAWLGVAAFGLTGRTLYLCVVRGVKTGMVWFFKILTDPFHDVMMYHKSPLHLMRGELFDPMTDAAPSAR